MTTIDDFNYTNPCDKIDADCVDAFVDFHLNADLDTGLCLETSWGSACLDLEPIVKAGETVTTLYLSPEEDPNCLVFEREDGEKDCIHGDDLSRIISMQYLKDVDQETPPENGDVYIYNDGKFYTFNLQEYMDNVAAQIQDIYNKINPILNRWEIPAGVPGNAKILLGNINVYSDRNAVINSDGTIASLDKTSGIYGHTLNEYWNEDEIFG